ncbi:MAG: 3-isopropylmalate dehydrogenase [Patescibacteria group bacterium]|nr:3-isopropylmalate dehydrogenase [Patescibacteria group bacterium]
MKKNILLLPGDGIGPEVIDQAVKVIKIVSEKFNHNFNFLYADIGHQAILKKSDPLPKETINLLNHADAILFGAIGDPYYDNNPQLKIRPEQGLLKLRKILGLYANLRPIKVYNSISNLSPLKKELIKDVDFIVIRELIGGIYFGKKGRDKNKAFDLCEYKKDEIIRIGKVAFELAKKRKKKVTLVDKANVLETSRLWRETIQNLSKEYPDIQLEMMFVDNASMQIIKKPKNFDVVLTENMFGDILTDEASVIAGSIGLLPSASIGEKIALYEPIHGSFPKATGKDIANPIGAILSSAMMFEYSFNLTKESKIIEDAVKKALEKGFGTYDINKKEKFYKCSEFGDIICKIIKNY